jgi:lipopolysaccharide export system permease protein
MDFRAVHIKGTQSLMILDRYVSKAVIVGSLVALLLLTSVNVIIDFVEEVNNVGEPGFTFLYAILSTLFTIPRRIHEIFPTAVLLGGLMSLGSLAAHNELVVMRVSGVSVFRIIRAVFMAGLVLVFAAFLLGEFVAPVVEQKIQSIKNPSQSKHVSLKTREGLWVRDGNRFINVHQVYTDFRLGNIRIYELTKDLRLKVSIFAKSAVYDGNYCVVNGVRRTELK